MCMLEASWPLIHIQKFVSRWTLYEWTTPWYVHHTAPPQRTLSRRKPIPSALFESVIFALFFFFAHGRGGEVVTMTTFCCQESWQTFHSDYDAMMILDALHLPKRTTIKTEGGGAERPGKTPNKGANLKCSLKEQNGEQITRNVN